MLQNMGTLDSITRVNSRVYWWLCCWWLQSLVLGSSVSLQSAAFKLDGTQMAVRLTWVG